MAIIRWNPLNLSSLFDDDWDMPTLPGISRLSQGLNIYETENAIVAEAAVPGVSEDKIDITFENGVVRITGMSEEKKEEDQKRRYFMTSMASSFNYSFRVPQEVVGEKEPAAELENGILRLTFKKAQKKEPKRIQVSKVTKKA